MVSTVSAYSLWQTLLRGWLTVTPNRFEIHCMTIETHSMISHSMEHELKQSLIWCNDSRCLGETRSLKVLWCQFRAFCLSIQWVYFKPKYQIWIHWRTYNCIPLLPFTWVWQSSFIDCRNWSVGYFWHVNSFNFAMCTFASQYLPIELVPCSDGWRELDDKQYIWFHDAGLHNSAI